MHLPRRYISETIANETIHAVVMQPTLLTLLLDEHNASYEYPLRSLRHVISSGEKLHSSVADAFVRTEGLNAKLWNMYGMHPEYKHVVDFVSAIAYHLNTLDVPVAGIIIHRTRASVILNRFFLAAKHANFVRTR